MKESIYSLFYLFEGQKNYFYVGRSKQPTTRMQQHRWSAKRGDTEAVYQFIRNLWAVSIDFDHEILAEVDETDLRYEAFYVYQKIIEGFELTNMKMGDAVKNAATETIASRKEKFTSPATFLTALDREIEEADSRAKADLLNKKVRGESIDQASPRAVADTMFVEHWLKKHREESTTVFVDDVKDVETKFESEGLKEIRSRR